jgi:hypothetical protein
MFYDLILVNLKKTWIITKVISSLEELLKKV